MQRLQKAKQEIREKAIECLGVQETGGGGHEMSVGDRKTKDG